MDSIPTLPVKKKGPKIFGRNTIKTSHLNNYPMRVVNMGKQAVSTRRNNIGIQAKQPIIEQHSVPPFNLRQEILEGKKAVEEVRHLEEEQLLDHKIDLSGVMNEQSIPITSAPVFKRKLKIKIYNQEWITLPPFL